MVNPNNFFLPLSLILTLGPLVNKLLEVYNSPHELIFGSPTLVKHVGILIHVESHPAE